MRARPSSSAYDPPATILPTIGLPSRQVSRTSEPLSRDYETNFRVTSSGTGEYRTTSITKEPSQPLLIISGVTAEVSPADFHHFLSRWGQVVDSSVTMQGYGTAKFATWAGTEALLAASPLQFKNTELIVRLPRESRGPSPERPRRPYEDREFGGEFATRERERERYEPPVVTLREDRSRAPSRLQPSRRDSSHEPKLYVGGIGGMNAEEFKGFMEQFGELADAVVMPKGFGFCTFKDPHATSAALNAGNLEFEGQHLVVQKARPRGGGHVDEEVKGLQPKLYVAGVGKDTTNAEFRNAMSVCGEVYDCIVMPSGFGFCTFRDAEGTESALRSKIPLNGRQLVCQYANPKQEKGSGREEYDYEPRRSSSRDRYERGGRGGDYDRGDRASMDRGSFDRGGVGGYERGYESRPPSYERPSSYDRGYDRPPPPSYERAPYDRPYDRYEYDRPPYYDRPEEDRYHDRYRERDYRTYERFPSPPRAPSRGAPPEEPKLYVGGVPEDLTNADFRDFLSHYGPVHDCVVMGGGFGFVTFATSSATSKALGAIMEIDGKKLNVQKAKPKKTREEWTTFESGKKRKS